MSSVLSNIDYKLAEAHAFKSIVEDRAKTQGTGAYTREFVTRGVAITQYSALAWLRFACKAGALLQQQGVQVVDSYTALSTLRYPALVFKFF